MMNRRQFLQRSATAGAMVPLPGLVHAGSRIRVLRVAHLTDIHVQPELDAATGMRKAFLSAQNQPDPPDLIINGGDSIMDALNENRDRVKTQWSIFQSVLKESCSTPILHCIGNHDVWGWGLEEPAIKRDPLYGKKWAIDELGLDSAYYTRDIAGWRFIVLDSSHQTDEGYTAKLDEAQFEWLSSTLESTSRLTPICIVSHIPILAACPFFDGENEETDYWRVPAAWMHIDARRIKDLFYRYANVKVCISGHIHLQDRVDYLGIRYLCNGAVSGNWWEGNYQEFPPAYVLLDFYNDGTVESQYVPYS